jgi:DNA-binding CsgD family transcriptional regulator
MHSLLSGDSEKQAAAKMGVSPHTVHVYVKTLYRRYNVSSRGELLSKWVKQ